MKKVLFLFWECVYYLPDHTDKAADETDDIEDESDDRQAGTAESDFEADEGAEESDGDSDHPMDWKVSMATHMSVIILICGAVGIDMVSRDR